MGQRCFLLRVGHGNNRLFDIANSTLGCIVCVHYFEQNRRQKQVAAALPRETISDSFLAVVVAVAIAAVVGHISQCGWPATHTGVRPCSAALPLFAWRHARTVRASYNLRI